MSVTGKRGVGIPIILLHDAEGGIVTVELKDGSLYRGILEDGQDNMNCTLKDCIKVDSRGVQSMVELAYVRGSQISFIVVPDTLKHAPFFNRIKLYRKFRGHAVFGANTAAINGTPFGRGGGGIGPPNKRPRMDGPGGGGPNPFGAPPSGPYGAPPRPMGYGPPQGGGGNIYGPGR